MAPVSLFSRCHSAVYRAIIARGNTCNYYSTVVAAAASSSSTTTSTTMSSSSSSTTTSAPLLPSQRILDISRINPLVKKAEYAVRGELAIRAEQLRNQLSSNPSSLPFSKIINCNIGNPQQLGQKPITFFRQVSSLLDNPLLLSPEMLESTAKLFPADVIARAQELHKTVNMGAYSHSMGVPSIRKTVAKFIEERDGAELGPVNPDHIFLTAGASDGVKAVLQVLIESPNVGIMIPIPQYPLYTAAISLYNGNAVPYYLNEEKNWSLDMDEVIKGLYDARAKGIDVRAICVINPGNPTGNVLSEDNIRELIDLCHRERLMILADEVYQTNIYYPETKPFHSFRKVLQSMGAKYNDFELISFHSISKGIVGECGRRGGYFDCVNIQNEVMEELYKLASISLCPNVHGQVLVDLMVNPPKPGSESFALYEKEVTGIYDSLKRRSEKLAKSFNSLTGVSCQKAEGSMYLFPQIRLPAKAIQKAESMGKEADVLYCLEMLDATGVCVVPGSGFLQKEGTYHFRSTFLPPEELFDDFVQRIRDFHEGFMKKYA